MKAWDGRWGCSAPLDPRAAARRLADMRTLTRLTASAALAATLALAATAPLLALEAAPAVGAPGSASAAQEAEATRDVTTPLIWTLVGTGLFCGALGALYLLKRELGGFEVKRGAWTAPISVIPSRALPVEESDFPEPADHDNDDGHGH